MYLWNIERIFLDYSEARNKKYSKPKEILKKCMNLCFSDVLQRNLTENIISV